MKGRKKNEIINRELKWFAKYVCVDYEVVKRDFKESLRYGFDKYGYEDINVVDLFTNPYHYVYSDVMAYLTWMCSYETVDEKIESHDFLELFPNITEPQKRYYSKKAKCILKDNWHFLKGTGVRYRKR